MKSRAPVKYAVALFGGFQAIDVFGPLDALNMLSALTPLRLSILSTSLDPVSTLQPNTSIAGRVGESILPTHTFETAPDDIEVLLVPGGGGVRDIAASQPVVDFIRESYPNLKHLLTVCTGSALATRSGVLDGKNATTNKRSFDWVKTQGPKVNWVRHARWVTDANIYTSSGVSAGIDMIYAFISDQYGEDVAAKIALQSEYVRNTNPTNDVFSDTS